MHIALIFIDSYASSTIQGSTPMNSPSAVIKLAGTVTVYNQILTIGASGNSQGVVTASSTGNIRL